MLRRTTFVPAHGGGVAPAMRRIELHVVDLTDTVGVNEIRRDETSIVNPEVDRKYGSAYRITRAVPRYDPGCE